MRWVDEYQVFLFDLDGLLVNTEELHFSAYRKMCADRGFNLDWDFGTYCLAAHIDCETLRNRICEKFPQLNEVEWEILYAEKKKALEELIRKGKVELMPGVSHLLRTLEEKGVKRCVVTHSSNQHVSIIREQNPVLNTIPVWFTRENYSLAKPHPEGYLKAIAELAEEGDKIIGFEDSPRGLKALLGTDAQPVFVSKVSYPALPELLNQGVFHMESFEELV